MLFAFGRSVHQRLFGTRHSVSKIQPQTPGYSNQLPAETVEFFAKRLGLDIVAIDWLYSLEPQVRTAVVKEFKPDLALTPEEKATHLYAFGRSVSEQLVTDPAAPSLDLTTFSQRWGITGESDANGSLQNFAATVQNSLGLVPINADAGSAMQAPQPGISRRTSEFISFWMLDDGAQASLLSLKPEVMAKVIDEFDPKGDITNISRKFMGFVRTVQRWMEPCPSDAGHQQGSLWSGFTDAEPVHQYSEVDAFADHWQLNEGARNFLQEMPPDAQARTIAGFTPQGVLGDASGKFFAFARSVAATSQNQRSILMSS